MNVSRSSRKRPLNANMAQKAMTTSHRYFFMLAQTFLKCRSFRHSLTQAAAEFHGRLKRCQPLMRVSSKHPNQNGSEHPGESDGISLELVPERYRRPAGLDLVESPRSGERSDKPGSSCHLDRRDLWWIERNVLRLHRQSAARDAKGTDPNRSG